MTCKELNTKIQDFVDNIDAHIVRAVQENEKQIVGMNQEQMLYGKNAENERIGFLRSITYAQAKIDRGGQAPFRVPDLFNTGAFQSRMFMDAEKDKYFIGSTDSKEPDLVGKYGPIFGLIDSFKEEAKELTTKSLSKIFTQKTGIKG